MSGGIRCVGDHVDLELRDGTCRTLDGTDGARLAEKVGEIGDVHRVWGEVLPRLVRLRFAFFLQL